eukprot:6492071-Amphidinium_carterae.1
MERDDVESDIDLMQEVERHVASLPEPTIEQLYLAYVHTTSSYCWRTIYHDDEMSQLTKILQHTHSPYCGRAEVGSCRFGFPMQCPILLPRKRATDEQHGTRAKNQYLARRRADSNAEEVQLEGKATPASQKAACTGMYNKTILQEWRASMDLQPIHRANAAAKYILGYVLKSDTDKNAEQEFERYIRQRQEHGADARDVYRAVHQFMKARVTSPSEASFLMQGLPLVSFGERANVWVPTGLPNTWRTYLPPNTNVAEMADVDDIPLNMPRVIAAYANRPTTGTTPLPVEGQADRAEKTNGSIQTPDGVLTREGSLYMLGKTSEKTIAHTSGNSQMELSTST